MMASRSFVEPLEFDKPAIDKKTYKSITLENGLKALLVHDPDCVNGTKKAAASLCLSVGKLHEPKHLPGLAHFCEHMLFLGTKKYPEESEYNTFAEKNGGSTNAGTSDSYTCYTFDINADFLEPMLDRFAEFFISPLFTKSATDREINAVNSEHEMNYTNDFRRLNATVLLDVNEKHPYHWGSGNLRTLKTEPEAQGYNLHEELMKFYNMFYSANLMTVCVVGGESLEDLEKLVVAKFTTIMNKNVTVLYGEELNSTLDTPVFLPGAFPGKFLYAPFKDLNELNFIFALPWQTTNWKLKPCEVLSHLVGHESRGSVLSALKKLNLATGLSAGAYSYSGCFTFMQITISVPETVLTNDNMKLIGKILFSYFAMLRKEKSLERHWLESQLIHDINFQFHTSSGSYGLVENLAQNLSLYPPNLALSADFKYFEYNEDEVRRVLDMLTPENLRLYMVGKMFEPQCTQVEPWHDGKYLKCPGLEPDVLATWQRVDDKSIEQFELAVPLPNKYIAKDLSLRIDEPNVDKLALPKEPVKIFTDFLSTAFWKPDLEFMQPKAKVGFRIHCPIVAESVETSMATQVLCAALTEELNEDTYDASLAGLAFSVFNSGNGITIKVFGLNDKIGVLLDTVLVKLVSMTSVSTETFNLVVERMLKGLRNAAFKSKPYQHASQELAELTQFPHFSRTESFAALQKLKRQDLAGLNKKIFSNAYVESFGAGNLAVDEFKEFHLGVLKSLDITKRSFSNLILDSEALFPAGPTKLEVFEGVDEQDSNNAILYALQVPNENSLVIRGFMLLLSQMIYTPFFTELRTKKQLGYVVYAGSTIREQFSYLMMCVQSEFPVEYLIQKQNYFLCKTLVDLVDALTVESFEEYKNAVIGNLKVRPTNVLSDFDAAWNEIVSRNHLFDRREQMIKTVDSLTKDETVAFVKNIVSTARKLVVEVKSTKVVGDAEKAKKFLELIEADTEKTALNIAQVIGTDAARKEFRAKATFLSGNTAIETKSAL